MASFPQICPQININKIHEIINQNIRLENELLIANKCIKTLITFKSFIDFISNKFKYNLNSNEWQKFENLRKDVEEVLKSKDELNKRKTIEKTQKSVPSEDVIDIEEDKCESGSNSRSTNRLNSTNQKSAQNETNSSNDIKINGNTIHSFEDNMKTTETNSTLISTLYSDNEMTPKALYKSNITYNRRKQSNNCSQNTDKSINKLNESTEEMTDPTTTQKIKIEIKSNDKTEEKNEFQYLSQDLKNLGNAYNSLNSSESQFSPKVTNNEKNIGFVDTTVGSEEQTNSDKNPKIIDYYIKCIENPRINIYNELEGPVIVNIKPSNSSTDPKTNSVFKCPIIGCNKWMTIDFIPKHSLKIHNQFVVICGQNKCKKVFTSSAKLEEHMTKDHTKDKQWLQFLQELKNTFQIPEHFICDRNDCHKVFTTEVELLLHKKDIHFVSKTEFESEVNNRSKNTSPVIMCSREDCWETFDEKLFTHHMIVVHKECTSVECLFTDCSQNFNDFEEYMNHLLSHSSEFWYKYYPKIYYELKVFQKHFISDKNETNVKELEGNDSKKCNFCGKVFRNKRQMQRHRRFVHILKPSIECDFPGCHKKFKYQTFLNIHKSDVHSSVDLKLNCNHCNRVFRHQRALIYHMSSAHSRKTFACDWPECQYTSKFKSNVNVHQAQHTVLKYVCNWPDCGKSFAYISRLKNHETAHSVEHKYVCDWPECGKAYKYKKSCDEHIRSHTNDMRYSCDRPGCSYKTITFSLMSQHKKIHR